MRFHLIDRIDRCEPGKALAASKFLALGEEYLKDHFPPFPIMPGVLMLQSCVEAASKNSLSSMFASAASMSVLQRAMPWALARRSSSA